jgi:hypothetical protein
LPADSRQYAEQVFAAKALRHERMARMSIAKKLRALDRLRVMGKSLPKHRNDGGQQV